MTHFLAVYFSDPAHIYAAVMAVLGLLSVLAPRTGKLGRLGKLAQTASHDLPKVWEFLRKTPQLAKLLGLLVSTGLLFGCASSFQTVPGDLILAHSPACQKLDGRRRTAGTLAATAIATGVAASASAAILQHDHPDTALKFSVIAVGTGSIAGGATWYEADAASTYREMCPITAPGVAK